MPRPTSQWSTERGARSHQKCSKTSSKVYWMTVDWKCCTSYYSQWNKNNSMKMFQSSIWRNFTSHLTGRNSQNNGLKEDNRLQRRRRRSISRQGHGVSFLCNARRIIVSERKKNRRLLSCHIIVALSDRIQQNGHIWQKKIFREENASVHTLQWPKSLI